MTIIKATEKDAGCYVDGHWGQYGIAHMIDRATEFGYGETPEQAKDVELAHKKLASMGPNTNNNPYLTDDEEESLVYAGDEAENWLNENVAHEGYSFYWNDGEFFYGSNDDESEE